MFSFFFCFFGFLFRLFRFFLGFFGFFLRFFGFFFGVFGFFASTFRCGFPRLPARFRLFPLASPRGRSRFAFLLLHLAFRFPLQLAGGWPGRRC